MLPAKRGKVYISIEKPLIEQVKREARRLYPVECYAVMLGERTDTGCRIEWLVWPDVSGIHSTEDNVMIKPEWIMHAAGIARDKGLEVIGDVHSHCYESSTVVADHAPSQGDWERLDRNYIQCICVVTKTKKGLRAGVKFWAMPPDAIVDIC